jgi:hypothetical protein
LHEFLERQGASLVAVFLGAALDLRTPRTARVALGVWALALSQSALALSGRASTMAASLIVRRERNQHHLLHCNPSLIAAHSPIDLNGS